MADGEHAYASRRAVAARNREKILAAAHAAFEDPSINVSMAEIARRADVGMATLYRNFSGRRELLEAVYLHEVDAVCAAAEDASTMGAGEALRSWLRTVFAFTFGKRLLSNELFPHGHADRSVAHGNRARALESGEPLLVAARDAGQVRGDLTLDQIFDLIVAVAAIADDIEYVEPILNSVLEGLRPV